VRRPPEGFDGGSWSPVISTVSRSGAETRSVTSATGLLAVSPLTATKGSRAQPMPGSQVSSGAPLPHHDTPVSVASRSNVPAPSETVKSSSTSVDSPAVRTSSRETT
jgi:hypothetical protein